MRTSSPLPVGYQLSQLVGPTRSRPRAPASRGCRPGRARCPLRPCASRCPQRCALCAVTGGEILRCMLHLFELCTSHHLHPRSRPSSPPAPQVWQRRQRRQGRQGRQGPHVEEGADLAVEPRGTSGALPSTHPLYYSRPPRSSRPADGRAAACSRLLLLSPRNSSRWAASTVS